MKGFFYATSRHLYLGWLLAYCLACFSSVSLADDIIYKRGASYYFSLSEACNSHNNSAVTTGGMVFDKTVITSTTTEANKVTQVMQCYWKAISTFSYNGVTYNAGKSYAIDYSLTISGIICGTTYVFDTPSGTCVNHGCSIQKGKLYNYFLLGHANVTKPACSSDNCDLILGEARCGYNAQNVEGCYVTSIYTGKNCSISPVYQGDSPLQGCPECDCIKQGKSYGYANGAVMCVNAGTSGSATPIKTVASNTSATKQGDYTSTSKTTVTTTTVSNVNGSPIVTETKSNSDGTGTSNTGSLDGFCSSNPNSALCKGSGTGQGFEDKDDNICAVNPDIPACVHWCEKPENANKASCQDQGDPETLNPTDPTTNNIDVGSLNSSTYAGTCPSNIVLPHNWGTLPMDKVCDMAAAYRPLVLLFSYITAAFIIFGFNKDS